jgi:hypothetical protein
MRHPHRLFVGVSALFLLATISAALPCRLDAATSVTVLDLANVDAVIAGSTVEDFEDTSLIPGVSVTFSTWVNASNVVTANGPVTYNGTIPQTWDPVSDGLNFNTYDGTRALVNGWAHDWQYPFAASAVFQFNTPQPSVGLGCSNFQGSLTSHELLVNGVSKGNLEALTGWANTIIQGKNGYLLIVGSPGEPISSIEIRSNTSIDHLVFDKLAVGSMATPTHSNSWGRVKALYR